MLSVSLLLAPAAAFNLATRFPKTPATCDARRSSNAVARLGFLQDTRATEMAGSESTTYGELYGMGGIGSGYVSPMSGFVGGVASTRGYGPRYGSYGGMGGYGMNSMYGNRYGMGSMYGGMGRYGGMGGYGMGMGMYNRGMGGMYGGGMYNRGYGGYGMGSMYGSRLQP